MQSLSDTGSQGNAKAPTPFKSLAELPPSSWYRNVLLQLDGSGTIENETPDRAEAVAWLDGWLDEPLGLVPAIVPPAAADEAVGIGGAA